MSSKQRKPTIERVTALCYVRQSFTRDANDMNSPERQRANIEAFCSRKGWIPEFYQDAEGHKSGRQENNRPGWLSLKKRLDDPDVIALVANDLSRIHRKTWRVGKLMDTLDEHGIHLALAAPGREVDTSTSMGRMMITILAMQDEAYANDISQRTKDDIAYRKGQGKTIGMPPFGTVRNKQGYLEPSPYGSWRLADGSHIPGSVGDDEPESGAVWLGYHDCARRILELYAENRQGIENIAYQIAREGWAFRDRKNNPRPINRDDIRRVIRNWPHYAGLSPEGRAKDRNASAQQELSGILHDTGRAVFPLELLRKVAQVEEKRSVTTRPFGSQKKAQHYALTRLLFCAHCEAKASETGNTKFRSRLSGVDQYGKLRYRHAEGVKCDGKARSVFVDIVEKDVSRLVNLFTVNPDAFPVLVELAVQSESGLSVGKSDEEIEREKQQALARYRRRIDAARHLFEDGDLTREEYLKRKQENERQIAHWETRTTKKQQAAVELRMCMETINQIAQVWDTSKDEDRQQMARMLFEYIVYDLDAQQIVDFRLKAWADRFLMLRGPLYETEEDRDSGNAGGAENENRSSLKETSDCCPIGDFTEKLCKNWCKGRCRWLFQSPRKPIEKTAPAHDRGCLFL